MRVFYILLQLFLSIFLISAGAISAALLIIFYHAASDLPDLKELGQEMPSITRLYTEGGKIIGETYKEYRLFAPIEYFPQTLINAFIATEDKNFYSNSGVDFVGIFRALLHNLRSANANLVGGSTITQQVAKNFLLTSEKSLRRKMREFILAFRINRSLSKDEIMELYLNKIYFGQGAYGAAAASLIYFDKKLGELQLEEMALLAALPQAPSRLNPFSNKTAAKERRNLVLHRMLEEGFIEKDVYSKAINAPLVTVSKYPISLSKSPYFIDEIKRELARRSELASKSGLFIKTTLNLKYQEIAEQELIKGLRAYDKNHGWRGPIANLLDISHSSSINSASEESTPEEAEADVAKPPVASLKMLALDSKTLREELSKFPVNIKEWKTAVITKIEPKGISITLSDGKDGSITNASLNWIYRRDSEEEGIFIDPRVGDVIVVSLLDKDNYLLQQIPAINGGLVALDINTGRVLAMVGGYDYNRSQFNVATQALRQSGSLFKAFVYVAALENGFTPTTLVDDAELKIESGDSVWQPKNHTNRFYGVNTIRSALEKSVNISTILAARIVGLDKIFEVARRFGVGVLANHHNYAAVLGSSEVDLTSITAAYAMIVNGGHKIIPEYIDYIHDQRGNTILQRIECTKCDLESYIPPSLQTQAERVTSLEVAEQVTSFLLGGVSRGTSQNLKGLGRTIAAKTGSTESDTWIVGVSRNIAIGVYVGFDNPQNLGKDVTGSRVALPIFRGFVSRAFQGLPDTPFPASGVKLTKVNYRDGGDPSPEGFAITELLHSEEEKNNIAEYQDLIDSFDLITQTN